MMARLHQHVLVIKLGALGDLVLCQRAFRAIQAAHPQAQIALLTQPAFADFARRMPWFDQVIVDQRPAWHQIDGWVDLWRQLRDFAPTRVYDLQGKFRQTLLHLALGGPWRGVEWSGASPWATFPRPWPPQPDWHYTDYVDAQLRAAGIVDAGAADLSWLDADVTRFALPENYAVLIPGCAPTRPEKRWPPVAYADLACRLAARGIAVVVVGTRADRDAIAAIKSAAPMVIDLGGQTSLSELAGLMRRAWAVIGNDTGPTHIAGAVGARTLALFTGSVNPIWSAPRGPRVSWLQRSALADLSVDEVIAAL